MRSKSSKREKGEEDQLPAFLLTHISSHSHFSVRSLTQIFSCSECSLRDRERKIIEIEKEELEKRENEVNDESFALDTRRRYFGLDSTPLTFAML